MTDFEVIDAIEKVRTKNNINWMNILRLAFKHAPSEARDIVKKIPLERLLIEPDAPYLSPDPYRGKRNEPAHVIHKANYLADMLNIPAKELYQKTTKNFFDLFTKAEPFL